MERKRKRTAVLNCLLMGLAVLLLLITAPPAARAETVKWAVTGGYISFDTATGSITACDSSVTAADIPAKIAEVAVISIGDSAFADCDNLTSINLPDSVTRMGNYAFSYCTSLTRINIPDSVTSIGASAFADCTSLTSIDIPDSVISIGNGAFNDCDSLTSINLPDSVNSIGEGAFAYCHNLTGITIPNSITSIENDVFYNCNRLTSISLPASVISIGDGAFAYCTSLPRITLPAGVTSIGNGAFADCDSLISISLPDKVARIGDETFADCDSLASAIFTGNIAPGSTDSTFFGDYVFYGAAQGFTIYYNEGAAGFSTPEWNEYPCYPRETAEYTVTFNSRSGTAVASQTVLPGSTAVKPADPTRANYTFDAWYPDLNFTAPWDFQTPITGNVTLYAHWISDKVTIFFHSMGGTVEGGRVPPQTVAYGATVAAPDPEPARAGYTLAGWYTEPSYTTEWSFGEGGTSATAGRTLYAKWEQTGYVATVDDGITGGTVTVANLSQFWLALPDAGIAGGTAAIASGASCNAQPDDWLAVRVTPDPGHTLQSLYWRGADGATEAIDFWDRDDSGGIVGDFYMPAQDVTICAAFTPQFTLSIAVNGSKGAPYSVSVCDGEQGIYKDIYDFTVSPGTYTASLNLPAGDYEVYLQMDEADNWYWDYTDVAVRGNTGNAVTFAVPATVSISGAMTCDGAFPQGTELYVYAVSDSGYYISGDSYEVSDPNTNSVNYSLSGFLEEANYTLYAYSYDDRYRGQADVTVGTGSVNGADISLVHAMDLRVTLKTTEPNPAFMVYVDLYEQDDSGDYTYVNSVSGSGADGTELVLEGAVVKGGAYRAEISWMYGKNYVDQLFVSEPETFTVNSPGSTYGIALNYNYPTDGFAALSGPGNLVAVDKKPAFPGDRVNLEIRYQNNGNASISPQFSWGDLPDGVTVVGSWPDMQVSDLAPGSSGKIKIPLALASAASSGTLTVPIEVEINNETKDFGAAYIEIAGVTINAPAEVGTGQAFTVYGEATGGSRVTIKDQATGKVYGSSYVAGRYYSAAVTLPASGTYHLIAQASEKDQAGVQSATVTVEVKSDPIAVQDVYYDTWWNFNNGADDDYSIGEAATDNDKLRIHTFWKYVDLEFDGDDFILEADFTNDSNITGVEYHFCGKDYPAARRTADGHWLAKLTGWGGSGIKPITATVTTAGGAAITVKVAEVTLLIDPSGIVTDKNSGQPVAGATVTCQVLKDGIWYDWDAENYGQTNPLTTDAEGRYGWMVPDGVFRVLVSCDGYEAYDSLLDERFSSDMAGDGGSSIIIPPPRTDVDIELTPKTYMIILDDALNGIIVTDDTAAFGKKVTVRVTPDSGFHLNSITVTDDQAENVPVTPIADGYEFIMPASDVNISASTAKEIDLSLTSARLSDNALNVVVEATGGSARAFLIIAAYDAQGKMLGLETSAEFTGRYTGDPFTLHCADVPTRVKAFLLDPANGWRPLLAAAEQSVAP